LQIGAASLPSPGAAVLAKSRPQRPCALPTGEAGLRLDDAAWSIPGRQFPQGFEDPEARGGDGMEFADDVNLGKIQFPVVWFKRCSISDATVRRTRK